MSKDVEYTLHSIFNKDKGILAIDERESSLEKRFKEWGVEYNNFQQIAYRRMLLSTPDIEHMISGVILSSTTFLDHTVNGVLTREFLASRGIVVGIKADEGLERYKNTDFQITKGLKTLGSRCYEYKRQGAYFTKWRSIIPVSGASDDFILEMSESMSEYAKIALKYDLVPVLEPELSLSGNHSVNDTSATLERVLKSIIQSMNKKGVKTKHCILKTSFAVEGDKCNNAKMPANVVAEKTIEAFKSAGLNDQKEFYGIVFLSGGLESSVAIEYLQEIKSLALNKNGEYCFTTPMTFSYGRALQYPAFKTWNGEEDNVLKAQVAFMQVLQKANKMYRGAEQGHGAGNGKNI